jgi:hypothetical protein
VTSIEKPSGSRRRSGNAPSWRTRSSYASRARRNSSSVSWRRSANRRSTS